MVAMLHWQTQQNSSSSVHSYHSLQMGLELRDGFLQWTPEPEVWSVTCTSSAHVTLPEPAGSAELHGRAGTCSGLGDSCAEAPPPCTRWRTRHFMPPCAHLPTHKHARRIRISNHFKSFFSLSLNIILNNSALWLYSPPPSHCGILLPPFLNPFIRLRFPVVMSVEKGHFFLLCAPVVMSVEK